jgi:hypothetical protein
MPKISRESLWRAARRCRGASPARSPKLKNLLSLFWPSNRMIPKKNGRMVRWGTFSHSLDCFLHSCVSRPSTVHKHLSGKTRRSSLYPQTHTARGIHTHRTVHGPFNGAHPKGPLHRAFHSAAPRRKNPCPLYARQQHARVDIDVSCCSALERQSRDRGRRRVGGVAGETCFGGPATHAQHPAAARWVAGDLR